MFKKFSTYIFNRIYKMGCLEGSVVPVLYIGRTVPTTDVDLPKVVTVGLVCVMAGMFVLWKVRYEILKNI
jgi:hypothetical protein